MQNFNIENGGNLIGNSDDFFNEDKYGYNADDIDVVNNYFNFDNIKFLV